MTIKNKIFNSIITDTFSEGCTIPDTAKLAIDELHKGNKKRLLTAMRDIVLENYNDENITEVVLLTLKVLYYNDCGYDGISILFIALSYKYSGLRNIALQVLEEWNDKATLKYLRNISMDDIVEDFYRISIIEQIENYGDGEEY